MRTIRVSLVQNLVLLIALISASILAATVIEGRRVVEDLSRVYIEQNSDVVEKELEGFTHPVEMTLDECRTWARLGLLDHLDTAAMNRLFVPVLAARPQITSLTTGDEAGNSYFLLHQGELYKNREVRGGPQGERARHTSFRDPLAAPEETFEPRDFDPRKRPWYAGARALVGAQTFWTEPYVFATDQILGVSAATTLLDRQGRASVLALNVSLANVSSFTAALSPSPHGMVFVMTEDDKVIGLPRDPRWDDPAAKTAALLSPAADFKIPQIADAVRAWHSGRLRDPQIFPFKSQGQGWWAGLRPYALGANHRVFIGVLVPEDDFLGDVKHRVTLLMLIAGAALLLAMLLALRLARGYSRPIRALVEESERIQRLDLSKREPIDSHLFELKMLADAHEKMRKALDSFSRYVPADLVRELLERREAALLGGRTEVLTVLFTDIRGFTTIAETLEPQALTAHLAEYFASMIEIIHAESGTVDKMIGDAIMAFWGAPSPDPQQARHAVQTCLRCSKFLAEFNAKCKERGVPPLHTGFGLAAGPAVVGNVGSPARLNYTALGDTVNLASRLEGVTKLYGVEILASEAVMEATGGEFVWMQVDRIAVKGKNKAVAVYTPLGKTGEVAAGTLEYARSYEAACGLFRRRDFAEAGRAFRELLAARPGNAALERLQDLAENYESNPPPPEWDGTIKLETK